MAKVINALLQEDTTSSLFKVVVCPLSNKSFLTPLYRTSDPKLTLLG